MGPGENPKLLSSYFVLSLQLTNPQENTGMSYLLLIESATKICSVALAQNSEILYVREDKSMEYSHSSLLTSFIEEVISEAGIGFQSLDAVVVSKGPGSYTGLRIGVSAAKGICYAKDIPLVAVNTLKALAQVAHDSLENLPDYLVPMLDARRMEVYNAVFDPQLQTLRKTQAEIIHENSFSEYLANGKVAFFGDGAPKCMELIRHPNAWFPDAITPSATGLLKEALRKFQNADFEDTAYFEPFYLKDFVAGKPRVKGLH